MSNDTQKHTPGPWTVISMADKSTYTKQWREIGPGIVAASAYDTTRWGESETVNGVRISEANARLIAAAPQLLAALKEATQTCQCSVRERDSGHRVDCLNPQWNAVIAEAEGRA